jgi:spore germination cell wall hydrolase CwlJ-like protein
MRAEDKQVFMSLSKASILGLCILMEAGTEPFEGKVAVASVVLNRADNPGWGWGNSVHTVITKPYQFSWMNSLPPQKMTDPQYNKAVKIAKTCSDVDFPGWDNCCMIADLVLLTEIPRNVKAMHYYADYIPKPNWAAKMKVETKIGHHIFLI